jgi:cysteine desulfurase
MRAMGRSEEQARSGIRFSFGKHTTEEEVDFAAQQVIACAGVRS